MKRYNAHKATGTATGVGAGSAVSGNSLFLGKTTQRVADLSAVLLVDAETDTLTLKPRWQVSDDASTWITIISSSNNLADVVIATGTSGADASVTVAVPCPVQAMSYNYARCQLVVGGTTGTNNDTYEIGYTYRVPRGQARRN